MSDGHFSVTAASVWQDIELIRSQSPLIHNITNYVAMNISANALLALGASPVMAHSQQEMKEMVSHSGALVLNIGTLSHHWVESMQKAADIAIQKKKPVILDPVGCGASQYRTDVARELLEMNRTTIVKANGSEVLSLCGGWGANRGVDSTVSSRHAWEHAQKFSRERNLIVVVTGERDYIVAGDRSWVVRNGSALMPKVTAMGCTASAVVGAFCAVNPIYWVGAVHAMAVMGLCGEMAEKLCQGPGTFVPHFLDALFTIDLAYIEENLKVERLDA